MTFSWCDLPLAVVFANLICLTLPCLPSTEASITDRRVLAEIAERFTNTFDLHKLAIGLGFPTDVINIPHTDVRTEELALYILTEWNKEDARSRESLYRVLNDNIRDRALAERFKKDLGKKTQFMDNLSMSCLVFIVVDQFPF